MNEYQPALLASYPSTLELLAEEQEAGKLHLASRTQAALYALQKGITSLEDIPALEDS